MKSAVAGILVGLLIEMIAGHGVLWLRKPTPAWIRQKPIVAQGLYGMRKLSCLLSTYYARS